MLVWEWNGRISTTLQRIVLNSLKIIAILVIMILKIGINTDPDEFFNFTSINIERLSKLVLSTDLNKVEIPPKSRTTFFDVLAISITEALQFMKILDPKVGAGQIYEELRNEKSNLEKYLSRYTLHK